MTTSGLRHPKLRVGWHGDRCWSPCRTPPPGMATRTAVAMPPGKSSVMRHYSLTTNNEQATTNSPQLLGAIARSGNQTDELATLFAGVAELVHFVGGDVDDI